MTTEAFGYMVRDIFSRTSSLGDKALAMTFVLLSALLLALIAVLFYLLVDSVGVSSKETTNTYVELIEVLPAHTTTIYIKSGCVLIPSPIYHPESYRLHFSINDTEVSAAVTLEFFTATKINQPIEVDYG